MKQRINNWMGVFVGVMGIVEVPLLAILLATHNMVMGRYGIACVWGGLAFVRFAVEVVHHRRTAQPIKLKK